MASQSLVQWSESGALLEKFLALEWRKLYIYGEKNKSMPVLQSLLSIETKMIHNASHGMMVEQPDMLYTMICNFFELHKIF